MRKKSKYKPRGVRLDAVSWVLTGMTKVSAKESAYRAMHLKNMSALDSLNKGTATRSEVDVVIGVINVAGSDTSAEFFEGRGYVAMQRNAVPMDDQWLTNMTMKKQLKAPAGTPIQ